MTEKIIAATECMYEGLIRFFNELAIGTRFNPQSDHFYCSFRTEDEVDVHGNRKERTIYLLTDSAVKKMKEMNN